MCHLTHAARPRTPQALRIEAIDERELRIVGGIDAVDQGKIVQRIKEVDHLIERLKRRYGILTHRWYIAVGELWRHHVDEGLPGDDAVIAPAQRRPIQDCEQVWDLA